MDAREEIGATQVRSQTKRAQRFPVPVCIRYRSTVDKHWYEGRIGNVSVSGILFRTDYPVPPGTLVEMIYELPVTGSSDPPGKVVCRGVVVRAGPALAPSSFTVVAAKISTYHFVKGSRAMQS